MNKFELVKTTKGVVGVVSCFVGVPVRGYKCCGRNEANGRWIARARSDWRDRAVRAMAVVGLSLLGSRF